jgi:CubicO group peptidase (beta-lactamase class C family)
MQRQRILRTLRRGAAVVIGVFACTCVAIVVTWIARGGVDGGLTAAGRLARYGPTDVYDFRRYPYRELLPSDVPAPFERGIAASAPAVAAPDGTMANLEDVLRTSGTLGFLVIQSDRIVFEYYAAGHGPQAPSQYFSVTKSILATLIGMAIDDGLIRSIDQPITDFVPELTERGFARTTLRQLLDMTSTLDYFENDNPFGLHILTNYTSRLESLILSFGLRDGDTPVFRYKSGDSALLSLALKRVLGSRTLTDYAQRRLWTPLGMQDRAIWSLDRADGLEKAWCCLAGSARDLAKLGRLYLARGRVGNRQVLPAEWIQQSAASTDAAGQRRYSLAWWPASRDGSDFLAAGKDGQFLYVAPERATIIVRVGERHGYETMGGWTRLFAALAAHDWKPR